MEFESIAAVTKAGMSYERMSLELASKKLALANVAFSSMAEAQKAASGINEVFTQFKPDFIEDSVSELNANQIKVSMDPSNPSADKDGFVYYLNVDHVNEMARLVTAVRAYEANVRAYNANSDMNASALQIGG